MNRFLSIVTVVALGLTVAGCGSKAPAAPSGGGSTSQVKFTAALLPANEVPPVSNAEASGSGTTTVTFNLTKDSSGTIIGASVDFSTTAAGFPPGTALTAAHIHPGAAGVNGGVLINTAIAAGEVTFASGSGSFTKTGIAMTVDQANSIIANPGNFYFNIHTASNPGGVARGQLKAQ